jgi:hypothetical protein
LDIRLVFECFTDVVGLTTTELDTCGRLVHSESYAVVDRNEKVITSLSRFSHIYDDQPQKN